MTSKTSFEIVFSKLDEILRDDSNGEFRVSFTEASPAERESIDELRRLAASVVEGSTTFMTS